MNSPHAHIFIVWQSGFQHLSRIIWELSCNFEIKHAEKIVWRRSSLVENLNRVYSNRTFTEESSKIKEMGGNELIFFLVVDKEPDFHDGVNRRVFGYKQNHRTPRIDRSFFGPRIKNTNYLHGSDQEKESLENFVALTGGTKVEFDELKLREAMIYLPEKVGDTVDLVKLPVPRFDRIQDVFEKLNKYVPHAVLRNWEGGADAWTSIEHEDIDILTNDYYKTLLLLGARPVFPQSYRVHHLVEVGDKAIPFDVRFVGDGYYDQKWQDDLLDRRVRQDGFNRLCNEDYFWTLLYHGVFHKRGLSDEYRKRLETMEVAGPSRLALMSHLREHGYDVTVPKDRSVKFHKNRIYKGIFWSTAFFRAIKNMAVRQTEDLSFLSKQQSLSSRAAELKCARKIKYGVYAVGGDLIIKTSDSQRTFLIEHEEQMLREVVSESFFPNVIDAFNHGEQRYLVLEKKPGRSLASVFSLNVKQQKGLRHALDTILEVLKRYEIRHRDIRPNNILITKEGNISLVDFQFAIKKDSEISVSNSVEKYILQGAEKNLGGSWYKKQAPDQDAAAVDLIVEHYSKRRSIVKFIRSSLRRFTFV